MPGAINAQNVKGVIERMREAGVKMPGRRQERAGGNAKSLVGEFQGGTPQQRFGMILARASELPQPAPETHFLRLFGQSDRLITDTSTTDGSVPQALMLMNGGAGQLISDPNCAAVTVAGNAATPDAKVESLYLAFLGAQAARERAHRRQAGAHHRPRHQRCRLGAGQYPRVSLHPITPPHL